MAPKGPVIRDCTVVGFAQGGVMITGENAENFIIDRVAFYGMPNGVIVKTPGILANATINIATKDIETGLDIEADAILQNQIRVTEI